MQDDSDTENNALNTADSGNTDFKIKNYVVPWNLTSKTTLCALRNNTLPKDDRTPIIHIVVDNMREISRTFSFLAFIIVALKMNGSIRKLFSR